MSQSRIPERPKCRNLNNTLRGACGWFRWQKEMRDYGWRIANGMQNGEGEGRLWVLGVAEIGQEWDSVTKRWG